MFLTLKSFLNLEISCFDSLRFEIRLLPVLQELPELQKLTRNANIFLPLLQNQPELPKITIFAKKVTKIFCFFPKPTICNLMGFSGLKINDKFP